MRYLIISFIFVFSLFNHLFAQTAPDDICKNGDCSPEIFSIQLNEALHPNPPETYSTQRTAHFIAAYKSFQQIKNTYTQQPGWQTKYDEFQLGGKNCLRHYQLDSHFAHEYLKNPDFKKFLEETDTDAANSIRNGFRSSRRGLNLERRMRLNCSREVKKVEQQQAPMLSDLPNIYQKLGQELGYFDKDGNLLKPLESLPSEAEVEQIEQMKEQVSQLPVGPDTKDKIDKINDDLQSARPRVNTLLGLIEGLAPLVATVLPIPAILMANAGRIKDVLSNLLGKKLKFPKVGLFDKIKNLFNKSEKLSEKAQELNDKSKDIQDKYDDLKQEAKDIKKEIDKREDAIKDLKKTIEDIAKKKEELTEKLEDKPQDILEELKKEVAKVVDTAKNAEDKIEEEANEKDKLLERLKELEKRRAELAEQLEKLKEDTAAAEQEEEDLEKNTTEAEQEVKEAEEEDRTLDEMAKEMDNLPTQEKIEGDIVICEEELKALLEKLLPIAEAQKKMNEKMEKIKPWPRRLLDKISNLKIFQNKLKEGKNGVPLAQRMLAKLDGFLNKATALGSIVEILTGKKNQVQGKLENINQKVKDVQTVYDSKIAVLDEVKSDMSVLMTEKASIKENLEKTENDTDATIATIKSFLERFEAFDKKRKCISLKETEEKIEEVKTEQKEVEQEMEALEQELEKVEEQEEKLEKETKAVEQEMEESTNKEQELKEEKEAIKKEYGKDMDLKPVTIEEWTEDFEVKREYWDAVFHPDDEVIEGYKGRYFQISLKDADKNVKLLFGPGEYFMAKDKFRDNYGAVIGAFVTEALHSMKKTEQNAIKLFIQGSADIAGQNTFKGKLDPKFLYDEINVLPYVPATDGFSGTSTNKRISPNSFTNNDLPSLRGNFLKEMIMVYSKKLSPILLEGQVKKAVNIADRNAVIYLFIPESLAK